MHLLQSFETELHQKIYSFLSLSLRVVTFLKLKIKSHKVEDCYYCLIIQNDSII